MNMEQRLELLGQLAAYMLSDDHRWMEVKEKAHRENAWFTPEFIDRQVQAVTTAYLDIASLRSWLDEHGLSVGISSPKTIGVVMAGNIPMAGFHDFLAVFLSGHKLRIKPSSKDNILIPHLVEKLISWNPSMADSVSISPMLKGCDAYIATGSNNSARYFEHYFEQYPHIIRRNRSSVAILTGDESLKELEALADDVYLYFGLGCRNITKLYIPKEYNFEALLNAWRKYNHVFDHNKYRNNYDYQLAILIINGLYYMTNGSILLLENKALFTPVSVVHYEFYDDIAAVYEELEGSAAIQAIAGNQRLNFGTLQHPSLNDFADGINTLQFLRNL